MMNDSAFKEHYCITILNTKEEYLCSNNNHLLKGMNSIVKCGIPSGCHGGGCGVCKIQIVEGDVSKLIMSRKHISEDEEAKNIVLACCVYPKSNISLKVIGKLSRNILKANKKKKYGFV